MEVKDIFRRPNRNIANPEAINLVAGNTLYCYTLFVSGTKVNNDGSIEIDQESLLYYRIAPFLKNDVVFSDIPDAQNLLKMSATLYKETVLDGYKGLVMGYIDHQSKEVVFEAYLENFFKLNNFSNIINSYFTLKIKEIHFDREIFEREYYDIVNHIAKENHLPVTVEQFILFKNRLESYVVSGKAEKQNGISAISEGLIRILERTFTDVIEPKDQLMVAKFLDQMGCIKCKITKDRKIFKPLSEIRMTESCEIVFLPNKRFIKIYS